MDRYKATRIMFSWIQNLDSENASKIMGVLFLQDHGEKEMIRLAFGPKALVYSMILKAHKGFTFKISAHTLHSSFSFTLHF